MRALLVLDSRWRSVRAVTAVFQPASAGVCGARFGRVRPDICCSVFVLLCNRAAATCLQSNSTGQLHNPLVGLPLLAEITALHRYGSWRVPRTVPVSSLVSESQFTAVTAPPRAYTSPR